MSFFFFLNLGKWEVDGYLLGWFPANPGMWMMSMKEGGKREWREVIFDIALCLFACLHALRIIVLFMFFGLVLF